MHALESEVGSRMLGNSALSVVPIDQLVSSATEWSTKVSFLPWPVPPKRSTMVSGVRVSNRDVNSAVADSQSLAVETTHPPWRSLSSA